MSFRLPSITSRFELIILRISRFPSKLEPFHNKSIFWLNSKISWIRSTSPACGSSPIVSTWWATSLNSAFALDRRSL
ncbi:MAG: hypothetical protein AB7F75_01385 [Planctomycetota bacterium]